MSIHSCCRSHCVRYALNKEATCDHNHASDNCIECSKVELFFRHMNSLLGYVIEQVDIVHNGGLVKDIEGIIRATNDVFEPSVTTYMEH